MQVGYVVTELFELRDHELVDNENLPELGIVAGTVFEMGFCLMQDVPSESVS